MGMGGGGWVGMGGTFFFSPLGNDGTGERPGRSGSGAIHALLGVGSRVWNVITAVLMGLFIAGVLETGWIW